MKIANVQSAAIQGARDKMQDVIAISQSNDGANLFGIFDGHGENGLAIAEIVSGVVGEVACMECSPTDSIADRISSAKEALGQLHFELQHQGLEGGTTATIAIVKDNQLGVVYLGDSEACYYPDDGKAIPLIAPHTVKNNKELKRIVARGIPIAGNYFNKETTISRAVGDFELDFMSAKANITNKTIRSTGTLVVASNGVWGHNHTAVEALVRSRRSDIDQLPRDLVNVFGHRHYDNAAAIVVRMG